MTENGADIACVIVEPLQRVIPAAPGFLEGLRAETSRHGIVLLFDEVVTGFRFAYGGAQQLYGVTPDLCTLGKALAGGYALAAVAGSRAIMAHFDAASVGRQRALYSVNTLNGNPVACAAGLATLKALQEPGIYDRVEGHGRRVMAALRSNFARIGLEAVVVGHPTMFSAIFTKGPITNYRDTQRDDPKVQARFNELLRERGVLKYAAKFYLSVAHTEKDISDLEAIFAEVVDVLKSEGYGSHAVA